MQEEIETILGEHPDKGKEKKWEGAQRNENQDAVMTEIKRSKTIYYEA